MSDEFLFTVLRSGGEDSRNVGPTGKGRDACLLSFVREDWPPCFESAVSELNQRESTLIMWAGFFLASFSKALGHSQGANLWIFFSGAPDYSPDTTSYQVAHIYERSIPLMGVRL